MNARNKLIIHESCVQQGLLTFQEAHYLVGVRKPFHAFLINPRQLWEGVLIFLPSKTVCRWPYTGTKCGINVTPTITSWLTTSWHAPHTSPAQDALRHLPLRPFSLLLLSCWQAAPIAFQTQPCSPAWHSKHPSFHPSPQPHFPDNPSGAFLSSLTLSGQTCFFFKPFFIMRYNIKVPLTM